MPMLTDLPVDILIEIYKAVLDNAPLTCPQIEDIDYEEECPCGRQGPCLPADYAALRATCRTLYNAYREGGSFLDMYCEKPYFVGDLQQAKVLTLVEEFRDEYERKEGRDGYVSYIELDKLRHRIETEPLSGPLLRKMVRNQHALREIIYMSNSEEWRCLMIQPNKNSTYREKRPHYCGIKGVHRLNIEYLTEAMLWRWALVQRGNKHIRRFLNWAFKTYFETGFTGDEYWDYLYDLSTALSKHRRREAVIFDFWQISKHEHIVKSKGFVDCYESKSFLSACIQVYISSH